MNQGGNKTGVYAAAAALRLLLFVAFPGLPDLLTGRVEISTPVTSFKRRRSPSVCVYTSLADPAPCTVQEGLFLYNHNVSPYDGGVYHQAPLFLPLFSLLPDPKSFPIFTYILYVLFDILSADALSKIADSGEAGTSRLFTSPRRSKRWSGLVVASL